MTVKHKSALLIVDLQIDFCPGGNLAVPEGDRIIPLVNRLTRGFERVVATQDWHPRDHVSFASNHPGKNPFDTIQTAEGEQVLWPDHCVTGTRGAEFHPELETLAFDLIIRKGSNRNLDSYSAFFENDHETPTGLHFYLQGLELKSVYLVGLALDVCVYYSALDALRLGFDVTLVEDACRGIDSPPGSSKVRLEEMKKSGAHILKAADVS
jgi:nicotinamidase/pyrazinamidase